MDVLLLSLVHYPNRSVSQHFLTKMNRITSFCEKHEKILSFLVKKFDFERESVLNERNTCKSKPSNYKTNFIFSYSSEFVKNPVQATSSALFKKAALPTQ